MTVSMVKDVVVLPEDAISYLLLQHYVVSLEGCSLRLHKHSYDSKKSGRVTSTSNDSYPWTKWLYKREGLHFVASLVQEVRLASLLFSWLEIVLYVILHHLKLPVSFPYKSSDFTDKKFSVVLRTKQLQSLHQRWLLTCTPFLHLLHVEQFLWLPRNWDLSSISRILI